MDDQDLRPWADLLHHAGCDAEVIAHCRAVTGLALRIAARIPGADPTRVTAGAMLHDLGRAVTHGMRHAVEGARLAAAMGQPDAVVAIIRTHIGAGIPAPEAVAAGLPADDYMPRSLEARIVAHADNLICGVTRQTAADCAERLAEAGLTAAAARIIALHRELSAQAGIDLDDL
ncbi:MAG: HD domain-containing protein [Planctomycetota bacterium]